MSVCKNKADNEHRITYRLKQTVIFRQKLKGLVGASNYINYVELHYTVYYSGILCVYFVVKYLCFDHMQEWFTVFEQYRRTNCVVSDLIMGNEFVFRVFANNLVGSSQEPCTSKDSALIQKIGETSAISTQQISPGAKKKLIVAPPPLPQVWHTSRPSTRITTSRRLPSSRTLWWTALSLQDTTLPSAVRSEASPRSVWSD